MTHRRRSGQRRGARLQGRRHRPSRATLSLVLGMAGLAVSALLAGQAGAGAAVAARPAAAVAPHGSLNGVTCVSAEDCIAVGGASKPIPFTSKMKNTAERWNGKKWSTVLPPGPSAALGASLSSVACTSASNCIAVGDYTKTSGDTGAQADLWNGRSWSATQVALPEGAAPTSLSGVACASASNCWAVGTAGKLTLIDHWDGTKWSLASSPSPHPARPNVLLGVACASARECWAVGHDVPAAATASLTERWNGSRWAVAHTPSSGPGEQNGDICSSSSACLAVGVSDSFHPLSQRWNGSGWNATTMPRLNGELLGVACVRRTDCVAVGDATSTSGQSVVLGERWNGSKWATMRSRGPAEAALVTLESAACTGASNCWAVGTYLRGPYLYPLIEHWNGGAWSVN